MINQPADDAGAPAAATAARVAVNACLGKEYFFAGAGAPLLAILCRLCWPWYCSSLSITHTIKGPRLARVGPIHLALLGQPRVDATRSKGDGKRRCLDVGRRHAARCVELVGFVVRAVRSIWRDSDTLFGAIAQLKLQI